MAKGDWDGTPAGFLNFDKTPMLVSEDPNLSLRGDANFKSQLTCTQVTLGSLPGILPIS